MKQWSNFKILPLHTGHLPWVLQSMMFWILHIALKLGLLIRR